MKPTRTSLDHADEILLRNGLQPESHRALRRDIALALDESITQDQEQGQYESFIKQLSKVTDPQLQKDVIRVVTQGFVRLELPEVD
jgi:hypothetical protein